MELESMQIRIRGFRAGLEVADGNVRLFNKAAKSDLNFSVTDIVGVTAKKPGWGRGYVAVQTLEAPVAPSDLTSAMTHPQVVPLAMGEWPQAEVFVNAVNRWLADNPAAARGAAEDPYGDVDMSEGRIQKHLGGLRAHLDTGEMLEAVVPGAYETKVLGRDTVRNGILAATDRRLLFYSKRMAGYDMESFPYDKITSFEQSRSMMGSKVTFFASGNRVQVKWIQSGQVGELQRIVRSRMGKSPDEPAAVSPQERSATEKIRELAKLRDEGLLSEDEFAQAKAKLLGL